MGNPGSEIEARVMVISGPADDNSYLLQGTKLRLIQSPMRLKLSCWRPRFKS